MSSEFSTDSSSLVDLKAEVFRKKTQRSTNKSEDNLDNKKSLTLKKLFLPSSSTSSIPSTFDSDELRLSASTLSHKAALYDRLKGSHSDTEEFRNRFLVNFNENRESEGGKYVEYTDPLGRTRIVSSKEEQELNRLFWEPKEIKNNEPVNEQEDNLQLLRDKWAREEEENLRKRDVHYNDVLFDEARTHGVSYYEFSRDASERAAQKEELDSLHAQTSKDRIKAANLKKSKKIALAARLKKVRDRKRLKMGLPLLPEETPIIVEKPPEEIKSIEEDVASELKRIRSETEAKKRTSFVREWDVGKEEFTVMSQETWVKKKRNERPDEFAPPSYSNWIKGGKDTLSNQRLKKATIDSEKTPASQVCPKNLPKNFVGLAQPNNVTNLPSTFADKKPTVHMLASNQSSALSLSDRLKLYRDHSDKSFNTTEISCSVPPLSSYSNERGHFDPIKKMKFSVEKGLSNK